VTRISIVLPYPVFGAAEDYALILACGVRRTAQEPVTILHLKGSIPPSAATTLDAAGVERKALSESDMNDIRKLRRILRSLGPEVVHVNQEFLPGMAAGLLLRHTPVVVTAHNPALQVRFSPRGRLLQRWTTPRVNAWIVLSERNAQLLAGRGGRPGGRNEQATGAVCTRSVRVIAPGLPIDRFDQPLSRADARRELGLPADAFILGTAGRLARQKRHDLLIGGAAKAANTVPDLYVAILGEGELREETQHVADELMPGRVRLLGHRPDVPRLLLAFDAFALPSDYEGLPFAILEAMAIGLPIIATDVQGSGEALTDGVNGILIEKGSSTELASAIERIAVDSTLAARLGEEAAASFRRHYTADRMVDETEALYRDVLRAR
jgi:glycosyltransferase involved in cell wall biosynthesis